MAFVSGSENSGYTPGEMMTKKDPQNGYGVWGMRNTDHVDSTQETSASEVHRRADFTPTG